LTSIRRRYSRRQRRFRSPVGWQQNFTLWRNIHSTLYAYLTVYFAELFCAGRVIMDNIVALDFSASQSRPIAINPIINWALADGWDIPEPGDLVGRLGERMIEAGLPVSRIRLTLRTLHPQFVGLTLTWVKGQDEIEEFMPSHAILQEERYLKSPYAPIFEGAGAIRRRLDVPGATLDFPILDELKEAGATDYVAMPLDFSDGRRSALTLAGDRAGGFTTHELTTIYDALPVLSRLFELHATRRTAKTILETYLGRQTGERVLNGQIKRGDGEDIHAVIWFCDLRASTALAEILPRSDFLQVLNDFFECMAGAVLDHGGEILRYMGDAALAIFPIGFVAPNPEKCPAHIEICSRALEAAKDAAKRLDVVNEARQAAGAPTLGFGIGLHLGDVMYGNIGVPDRLEFTVIGSAANQAARIEGLCKALDRRIILSADVAHVIPDNLVALGSQVLRGVRKPVEVFTIADD
jgi:adenylate cyclase